MSLGPDVQQFVESATAFCDIVEHCPVLTMHEFVRRVHRVLPTLYAAALQLPQVQVDNAEIPPSTLTYSQVQQLRHEVASKLGQYNLYWEALHLFALIDDKELGVGEIADDLVDVYCDLKFGLAAFDTGSTQRMQEAVWQWKFEFASHWGNHLVDALRVLHRLVISTLTDAS